LKPRFLVETGAVPDRLLAACRREKADLIVVGARKEDSGTRFALGSNGDRIIREASVPVLAVPVRAVSKVKQAA
jgi:nucleotide-binding universal stress UspA family protein